MRAIGSSIVTYVVAWAFWPLQIARLARRSGKMSKLAVLSGQADVELGGTSTGERWWTCRKFSGTTIIAYMVPYTNHVNTLSGSRYMVMCHYVSENRRENMQRNHVAIFRQIGGSASLPPPTPACRDEKHSIDLLVAFPTRAQRISDVKAVVIKMSVLKFPSTRPKISCLPSFSRTASAA